jgi:hypothetical protein
MGNRVHESVYDPLPGRETRMCSRVNLPETGDGNPGIELRRREGRMPQQLLDKADVGPVLQHVRSAGMPKQVARAGCREARADDVLANHVAQPISFESFAEVRQEQGVIGHWRKQARPDPSKVVSDPSRGTRAQGNDSVSPAKAGGIQRLQDRPVPHARGQMGVRLPQHASYFVDGRYPARKAAWLARQHQRFTRVVLHEPSSLQPLAECAQWIDAGCLRRVRERPSVGLEHCGQMALVALERGQGNLLRALSRHDGTT